MTKLFKNYVFLFIFSGITLALGVLSLPPIKLPVVKSVIATWLLVYLVFFLFKRLSSAYGRTFLIVLSEFVVISLIAAGLFLAQFGVIKAEGLMRIIGFTLWVHAICVLIREYYSTYVGKPRSAPPYVFISYIALLSVASYTIAAPFVSDLVVTWVISSLTLAAGVTSLIFAIIYATSGQKSLKESFT